MFQSQRFHSWTATPLLLQVFLLPIFMPISFSVDEYFCVPTPFNCGNINSIRYPFGASGRPSDCSYPGFELACEDGIPQIEIGSHRYQVKRIDYDNQTLTVVDRDLVGKICPLPLINATIDFHLFEYASFDVNLTLYFNCQHPAYSPGLSPLLCVPEGSIAYFVLQSVSNSWVVPPQDCDSGVVSLHESFANNLKGNPLMYGDAIEDGFTLKWIVDFGKCGICTDSGGHCGYNATNPSQPICYCGGRTNYGKCPKSGSGNDKAKRRRIRIIIGVCAGIGSFFLVCLLLFCSKVSLENPISFCERKVKDVENVEAFLKNYGSLIPRRYQYSELKKITDSFEDKLGQGGCGSVFKGKLSDGRLVAVKVLDQSKGSGEEFINEVASIGRTNHVNIVALLGFCFGGSKRALVYEFMPNGSLERFIYSEKQRKDHPLGWQKLSEIALGIARGLEYLHRGCNTRILHFDIKPHNILLDKDFCPKISDFGLAKLCPSKESIISLLGARGTIGYIAPEVYCRNFGGVSSKSDVYSYGMMVLEMVGGRRNIDAGAKNTSEIYFPEWIYKRLDRPGDLGLHEITAEAEEEIARKMIVVGLWCIQTDPRDRPSMGRVVEMLEGSLESLSAPRKPFLSSPTRPNQGSSTTSLS